MGVNVHTIEEGTGAEPVKGQYVTMLYTGLIKNKEENLDYEVYIDETKRKEAKIKEFDSTSKPGRGPFITRIGVGQVIKGWDEGVVQMKVGGKALLDITSDYGYGAKGFPGAIPEYADLIFIVTLQDVSDEKPLGAY